MLDFQWEFRLVLDSDKLKEALLTKERTYDLSKSFWEQKLGPSGIDLADHKYTISGGSFQG